jgi:hypothetical protein
MSSLNDFGVKEDEPLFTVTDWKNSSLQKTSLMKIALIPSRPTTLHGQLGFCTANSF